MQRFINPVDNINRQKGCNRIRPLQGKYFDYFIYTDKHSCYNLYETYCIHKDM